ncbi:MAG: hypothetical protein KatS3mg105_4647 [Gemmatales bacterium]|nr:MAG: hypothetical protein KatS3mg105_4647 [Gemmatales bacterium]
MASELDLLFLGEMQMQTQSIEEQFDAAMLEIYRRAKSEANYNATRFFQMLAEHRGLETARRVLHAEGVSEGYTAMWECGRLDLTAEALIYDHPEFHSFFTEEELEIARSRLAAYKYQPIVEDELEQSAVLRYSQKQASKVAKDNPY